MTSSTIKPIDAKSIHLLNSGQVVLDLATAAKELIENALDAGATEVDVRIAALASADGSRLEVADNGAGIAEANYAAVCRRHATSKLATFDDLTRVRSFGFRGEALASLCAMGDVELVTRDATRDVAAVLRYDARGELRAADGVGLAARERGTTVRVSRLFYATPVRAQEFRRHARREAARVVEAVQAYALVAPRARLTLSVDGRVAVASRGGASATVRDAVQAVFDARFERTLRDVRVAVPDDGGELVGLVSSSAAGAGRSSADRQFFYVNGRPMDAPRLARALNDVYRRHQKRHTPACVLDVRVPRDAYDVNVTPDKRRILLHNEAALLDALRGALDRLYEAEAGKIESVSAAASKKRAAPPVAAFDLESLGFKRAATTTTTTATSQLDISEDEEEEEEEKEEEKEEEEMQEEEESSSEIFLVDASSCDIACSATEQDVLSAFAAATGTKEAAAAAAASSALYLKNLVSHSNKECEEELERVFSRDDYARMTVVGQFNRGFIVARLGHELFIIDQHAADEKVTYERLMGDVAGDMTARAQPLLAPLPLTQLGAHELETLREHAASTVRRNGFSVCFDDDGRALLCAVPSVFGTAFDAADLAELLALLRVAGADAVHARVRMRRLERLVASRACRSSIMIGTALTHDEMRRVLRQLAQLERAFCCPHGRPIIRHLITINRI